MTAARASLPLSPSFFLIGSKSTRGLSTKRDTVPEPEPDAKESKASTDNQERKRELKLKLKLRLKVRKEPRSPDFPTVCCPRVLCTPHSSTFPFLFNFNGVCHVQEPPPAVGQAPDLMTNPQMAVLVAAIDAAVLFPFYAEVNINNAKFRWYKTGQLEEKSRSFYAVRSAVSLLFYLFSLSWQWHILM